MTSVPAGLRHAVVDEDGGRTWLDSIPALVARAIERWDLVVGEPFETGMAGWTAPATTATGGDVVVKLSYPHDEARDEAAALRAWHGVGAVELLDADTDDWALLLQRLRPGTTLFDARLPTEAHLAVGAELLHRMATVAVPGSLPFRDLVEVANRLAVIATDRVDRLLPESPIEVDSGLCHAIELLRSLPNDAALRGLAHGDLNPGNILRHDDSEDAEGQTGWRAIDPKPVFGDRAWDPWPLVTQVGDWTVTVPAATELADRARLVADLTGLDPARIAAWCVARGVESGLWAADRGWWSGFRGADGDFARAAGWARTLTLLGD